MINIVHDESLRYRKYNIIRYVHVMYVEIFRFKRDQSRLFFIFLFIYLFIYFFF